MLHRLPEQPVLSPLSIIDIVGPSKLFVERQSVPRLLSDKAYTRYSTNMASYEEETASDRERRRERRRERHKRRAERHAKRASASPDKNNITVTPHPLNDDPVLEPVHLSSMEQRDPESRFRTAHDQKEFHQTIDPYPPPTMVRPDPVEVTDAHLNRYDAEDLSDLQQYSYDHGHERGSSAHHQRKERHDRHGHEKRKQHHESQNRQYYDEKHRSYHSETLYRSPTDDYKTAGNYAGYEDHKSRKWSWKKKLLIIVAPIILLIIIILAVAIAVSKKHSFKYTPSFVQVTNSSAFTNGGASKDANNTDDGIGAGTDRYIYYSGPASQFPPKDQWVSFADMWAANRNVMLQACKILDYGKNDRLALLLSSMKNAADD